MVARDIPIPFQPPMVRGLIREAERPGTGKSQTRRILKPQPDPCDHTPWANETSEFRPSIDEDGVHCAMCGNGVRLARTKSGVRGIPVRFSVGDRLWVREAWRTESRAYDDLAPSDMDADYPVIFEADADWKLNKSVGRLRAGMHMPRWASRLTLIVTAVRVQRLQEISTLDAKDEGIPEFAAEARKLGLPGVDADGCIWDNRSTIENYAVLWNSINGAGAWAANPWIVAVTFRVIRANIDSEEARHAA